MAEIIKFYRSTGKFGFLSNLYRCKVIYEGIEFGSSEHAYQYGKAKSADIKEYIKSAPTPAVACIVGHGLFPWMVAPSWKDRKLQRMRDVLFAKFTQNEDLRNKLVETGDAILIENSKSDGFWGIGRNGKGKNVLGKLLMNLRGYMISIDPRPRVRELQWNFEAEPP